MSVDVGNATTFGEVAVVRCNPGFKPRGSWTSKCEASGHWNLTQVLKCELVGMLRRSILSLQHNLRALCLQCVLIKCLKLTPLDPLKPFQRYICDKLISVVFTNKHCTRL